MLVVLFGPSGVGKSSLIRLLSSQYGYDVLRTVTTRPPRSRDEDRASVSDTEYEQMVNDGDIVPMSMVFGFKYALEQGKLNTALRSRAHVYLLDFALENWQDISALGGSSVGILVMAPSEEELKQRLTRHGRDDRVDQALRQHQNCQDTLRSGAPSLIADRVVVNDDLKLATAAIHRIISVEIRNFGQGDHFGFMDDVELLRSLKEGGIFERGTWSPACVHQASYGLRIDTEAQLSSAATEALTGRRDYQVVKVGGSREGFFELEPGDSALLYSTECFQLNPDVLALTTPRGFLVAQSLAPGASYVDPGFSGKFCIPVTNMSARVVRVPAGIQAVRVHFFRLGREVRTPWSSADATSLKSELDAAPSRRTHTAEQLSHMSVRQLLQQLKEEGAGGAQAAELYSRMTLFVWFVLAVAGAWPVALWAFNSDAVQNWLAKIFTDGSSFIGNVLAGIVTAGLGLATARIIRLSRNLRGREEV